MLDSLSYIGIDIGFPNLSKCWKISFPIKDWIPVKQKFKPSELTTVASHCMPSSSPELERTKWLLIWSALFSQPQHNTNSTLSFKTPTKSLIVPPLYLVQIILFLSTLFWYSSMGKCSFSNTPRNLFPIWNKKIAFKFLKSLQLK